jgi:integrase
MAGKPQSFRVGRVLAYLRGRIWYLCYHQDGRRRRPRVGPDREAARRLAAETNAQLEAGAPGVLSFEPIAVAELRSRWLGHHEQVLRSSLATVNRYRTATDHLLAFLADSPGRLASDFQARHAEDFVRHLRTIRVAPNGHPHSARRPLLDKGIKYVLECCRALFGFALRRRHLSPYAENPFSALRIERIPVEVARPIVLLTPDQERAFLEACDAWQFPLFLTLLLTGLRPGELAHLLLPDDLDLAAGVLRVRNKAGLGWRVKTRSEREVPLISSLAEVLRRSLGGRSSGPVFRSRRYSGSIAAPLAALTPGGLERELARRLARSETEAGAPLTRAARLAIARGLWRDAGAVKEERIRLEFLRVTRAIGLPGATAPKLLRHQFATALQEGRVDPLVRNELMGHSAASTKGGLGMTAVYTHTRPETRREQLESALRARPGVEAAGRWLSNVTQ